MTRYGGGQDQTIDELLLPGYEKDQVGRVWGLPGNGVVFERRVGVVSIGRGRDGFLGRCLDVQFFHEQQSHQNINEKRSGKIMSRLMSVGMKLLVSYMYCWCDPTRIYKCWGYKKKTKLRNFESSHLSSTRIPCDGISTTHFLGISKASVVQLNH